MSGISAQGTTLEVSSGTGSAQNITDVIPGFPTIIEIVGHGRGNGDVVTLASITGSVATSLNTKKLVIKNVTADTFAVDVDTTGLAYTSGGTATPQTNTKINGIQSFSGFDGQVSEIDTTDLDSTAMEYISGLKDEGNFSLDVKVLHADPGQLVLRAALSAGTTKTFTLTFPDATVATFNAFVRSFPVAGGVNELVKVTVDMRITGPVVYS